MPQKYKENRTDLTPKAIKWMDTVLAAQFKKQPESDTRVEIEHIIDFIVSDAAPKSLQMTSFDQMQEKARKWVEDLQKQGACIAETEADTEIVHDFGDGFKLVKLLGKAAFDREGSLMRHCVASYYGKSGIQVFSLRDAQNKPHCTMDITSKNGRVNQIKGKGNGSVHPKYINYMITILQKLGKEVNEHDVANLGYCTLPDWVQEFIETEGGDLETSKKVSLFGKTFFYKNQVFLK